MVYSLMLDWVNRSMVPPAGGGKGEAPDGITKEGHSKEVNVKLYKVRDLMVPLSEYAIVSEDATLYEAVVALEQAQEEFDPKRYRHRAVLVHKKGVPEKIVGKLSMFGLMRGLEPRYREIGNDTMIARAGFSPAFLKAMQDQHSLWDEPLRDICRKAAGLRVENIMHSLEEGEFLTEDTTLDEAIHRQVTCHHQSLLVVNDKRDIVGILRTTDVFTKICEAIKACEL